MRGPDGGKMGLAQLSPATSVAIALGIGGVLRVWGLDYGLPCIYCRPDESTLVHKALAIAGGEPNPHFFNYPSLQLYLLALVYGGYYAAGWLAGWFSHPSDLARAFFLDPSRLFLLARLVTAAAGTVSIAVTYCIGRRLSGRATGILSAWLLALAYLHIRESHFATVDVPALLWSLVSLSFAMRYIDRGERTDIVFCGLFLGLGASTKYSAALFAGAALAAVWLGTTRSHGSARSHRMALLVAVAGIAFAAGTPFSILDPASFWRDLSFEGMHYGVGHGETELQAGSGWAYYLTFVLRHGLGPPLLGLGLLGTVLMAFRRTRADLVLLSAMGVYFLVLGAGRTGFVRYAVPLVPLLCVAGGQLGAAAWQRSRVLGIVLISAAVLPSAKRAVALDQLLGRTDTRVLAGEWLARTVPSGETIAMLGSDFGFPYVRRSRQWLEDAFAEARGSGAPAGRLEAMLAMPDYPPQPAYFVVQVNPQAARHGTRVWRDIAPSRLRAAGIEWVVTHTHPLSYSRVSPALRQQLALRAERMQSFDPLEDVSGAVYDSFDAFYVPFAGMEAVTAPGPRIDVYKVSHHSAESTGGRTDSGEPLR